MDNKQDKVQAADELLAAMDTAGMSVSDAERVLADPNAPQDRKDRADEILSEIDSTGLTPKQAEQIVAENEGRPQ